LGHFQSQKLKGPKRKNETDEHELKHPITDHRKQLNPAIRHPNQHPSLSDITVPKKLKEILTVTEFSIEQKAEQIKHRKLV
jgi:hypothetical protein